MTVARVPVPASVKLAYKVPVAILIQPSSPLSRLFRDSPHSLVTADRPGNAQFLAEPLVGVLYWSGFRLGGAFDTGPIPGVVFFS